MGTYPSVGFPVYGLSASSWMGPRWLAFVQGSMGEPLYEIHLAHGSSRDVVIATPWVYLVTVPWPRFARLMHGRAESDRAILAWCALFRLFDFTTPEHPRARELHRKQLWLTDERAEEVESWPRVELAVDGERRECSMTRWAGAWAAIIDDLDGAAIILTASGVEPEDVALAKLTDGSQYHAGQTNGIAGAAQPGILSLVTGLHTGMVPIRVEAHDGPPAQPDDSFGDVVETSVTFDDPDLALVVFDDYQEVTLPAAGSYRARYSAHGMDAANEVNIRMDGDPAHDHYLLQLWPAPPRPDAILRQTSAHAEYWHALARATRLPSPEGKAAAEAEEAERKRRLAQEMQAQQDLAHWGGQLPSEKLRAAGRTAHSLALIDRELAERIASVSSDEQRRLAAWVARRAWEYAGHDQEPWIAAGLAALDRRDPMPPPWNDTKAAWDPALAEYAQGRLAAVHEKPSGPSALGKSPVMAAFAGAVTATLVAAGDDPGEAAFAAVFQAAAGQPASTLFLAEVRRQLDSPPGR